MGLRKSTGLVGPMGQIGRVGHVGQVGRVRPPRRFWLVVLLIAVFGTSIIHAGAGDTENVTLTVGRSLVLDTGHPITRVSLTSADIADALVTSASELLINGKTPGTISMFVWDRSGGIHRYEVVVQRDLTRLGEQLQTLFPGESITAQPNGRSIVLSGRVTSKEVIDRAVSVAAGYVDKKEDVVPLLQVQAARSNQVLLHVRFAEVSRSALTELGATWFTSNNGYKDVVGRVTTEQFPSVDFTDRIGPPPPTNPDKEGKMVFADFLNVFLFSTKYQVGTLIRALQTRGLFQSLAEPNLVAESGKEASFLAGGEIPVPVAQGAGGTIAISVQWKEFGIRLNFLPTVNGDVVHLKVRPEVSTLDFGNAVLLQGFRIPALATRRAETEIELTNNQTFAIAGLLNNTATQTLQKMPGIGDIPILGLLFQSKAAQKNQTELVVMITPEILPHGSPGVTPNLPRQVEPYLGPVKKSFDAPPPAFRPGSMPGAADDASAVKPPVASAPATVPAATPPPAAQTPPPDPKAEAAEKKEQAKAAEEARKQAERDQKEAAEQKKRDDKAAREQAKRDEKAAREKLKQDSAAAKKQTELDKAAQEVAAKKAAEDAKQQTDIDKKKQKALDEAQARLKAAEAAYQAELAKRGTRH
jgi:pilus assembly protein CpaC